MRVLALFGALVATSAMASPSPSFTTYLTSRAAEREGGGATLVSVRAACEASGESLACAFTSIRVSSNAAKGCSISAQAYRGHLKAAEGGRWRGTAAGVSCAKWDVLLSYDDTADKWRYEARDVSAQSDKCPPPLPTKDVAEEYTGPFTFPPTQFRCERIIGMAP